MKKLFGGKNRSPKSTAAQGTLTGQPTPEPDPQLQRSHALSPPPRTSSQLQRSDPSIASLQGQQPPQNRVASEDENWVVLPQSHPSQPRSTESRSSSLHSLPPGASPPNPYPPAQQHPPSPYTQPPVSPAIPPPNNRQLTSKSPKSHVGHGIVAHLNGLTRPESVEDLLDSASVTEKPHKRGLWGVAKDKEKKREEDIQADVNQMMAYLTLTASDDWSLVLEVCERVTLQEYAAKEVVRYLRREIKYSKPQLQLIAARLWAIIIVNTNESFLSQCGSRKFINSLEDVITAQSTAPVVRERLLDILAAAAYATRSNPKDPLGQLWRRLRPANKPDEGIPFDPEDPMFNPPMPRRASAAPFQGMAPQAGQGLPPITPYTLPTQPSRKEPRIIPPDEDMRRLFEECDIAQGNAQLLSNALTYARPEDLTSNRLIKEFYSKSKASQTLIFAQIPWATAGADRSRERQLNDPPQPNQGPPKPTKEERLLEALLAANSALLEALRVYDELEQLGRIEQEEREIEERSRKEVRLDRTQIKYIAPDGTMVLEQQTGTATAGGSSRSASPVPSPSPLGPPAVHGPLPTPPNQQVHSHHGHHHSTSSLAPPPPAPHGPRKPANHSRDRSRTPSPDSVSTHQNHDRPRDRVESLRRGIARIDVEVDSESPEEDEQTPVKPSEKALGKRKAQDPDPDGQFPSTDRERQSGSHVSSGFDPNDIFKDQTVPPFLKEDRDDPPDGEEPPSKPIQYAYDAAAELIKERQREAPANGVVH